jgi:hypothetical protein
MRCRGEGSLGDHSSFDNSSADQEHPPSKNIKKFVSLICNFERFKVAPPLEAMALVFLSFSDFRV